MQDMKDMNETELTEYFIQLKKQHQHNQLQNAERIIQFEELKIQHDEFMAAFKIERSPVK